MIIFAIERKEKMKKKKLKEPEVYQITDEAMAALSMDALKLYYDTAQKRMSDYHQQARETTERAYKVISIYITILTLLSAYLYKNWNVSWSSFAVLALLAGACSATICMLKLIFPRNYMPLGRRLSDLKPNEYAASFGNGTKNEMQMRCILRDEINMLEYAIQWQGERNRRRARLFACSLIAIVAGILVSALLFLPNL